MPYTTITLAEAKPVANYKMATRMEGGRLLYIAGQVARDAGRRCPRKGDIRNRPPGVPRICAMCAGRGW
jgi:enamine deaminase RidA (YjgF/YER057c/UK114 family)